MKRLLLLLTACAADVPGPEVYKCTSVFVCDGGRYPVLPAEACADTEDAARFQWQFQLDELAAVATCTTETFETTCKSTGAPCPWSL